MKHEDMELKILELRLCVIDLRSMWLPNSSIRFQTRLLADMITVLSSMYRIDPGYHKKTFGNWDALLWQRVAIENPQSQQKQS